MKEKKKKKKKKIEVGTAQQDLSFKGEKKNPDTVEANT